MIPFINDSLAIRLVPVFKKALVYVLIAALLLTAGLFVYSGKFTTQYPDYSSYNTRPKGVKALYLLTQKMGYHVEQYKKTAKYLPDSAVLIAVKPDINSFNDTQERKSLQNWITRGNTLMIIDDFSNLGKYNLNRFRVTDAMNYEDVANVYSIGKGTLIFMNNPDSYTNNGLKEIEPGVVFINMLDTAKSKRVLFDEYYHGMIENNLTLWDLLGQTGRLIVIQLLLGLLLFMFIKARRFGKPVIVFETIKRKENENLYALSNLYMRAGANSSVLEAYLSDFKKELSRFLGFNAVQEDKDLIYAAEGSKVLSRMNLRGLMQRCHEYVTAESRDTKQLLELVKWMEEIRKGIKQ